MEFLTREERSRRLLRVHGIEFVQPAPPPPAVPYAAHAVQRALRRAETDRHLQSPVVVLTAYPPTPALYAALVRASALRRRCTRRKLRKLPTEVWNVPTTSRPGDNYRALAEPIVTRTSRSRKLRLVPRVPEQFPLAAPAIAPPSAYAAPRAHKRDGWRRLQLLEEIDRYPQSPSINTAPWVATQRVQARRRPTREGLLLAADDVNEARVTAQYPSYVLRGFFRRDGQHRQLLHTVAPPFQPALPAPPQPLPAWLAPCVNRRHGATHLRTPAELNEHPPTPPVPPQPVPAWAEWETFRREGWRTRQSVPELDVYSRTPGQVEAPFPGWIPPKANRRCGWRLRRAVEDAPADVKLAPGHQPYGAWLAHEVTRRHGWLTLQSFATVGDYAEPEPEPFPGTPNPQRISVAALSRSVEVTRRSKTITAPVRSTTITVK